MERCARAVSARPVSALSVAVATACACALGAHLGGGLAWAGTTPREWVLARDGATATADAAEAANALGVRCGDAR